MAQVLDEEVRVFEALLQVVRLVLVLLGQRVEVPLERDYFFGQVHLVVAFVLVGRPQILDQLVKAVHILGIRGNLQRLRLHDVAHLLEQFSGLLLQHGYFLLGVGRRHDELGTAVELRELGLEILGRPLHAEGHLCVFIFHPVDAELGVLHAGLHLANL